MSSSRSGVSLLKLLLNREIPLANRPCTVQYVSFCNRSHQLSGSSANCITTELVTVVMEMNAVRVVHVNVDLRGACVFGEQCKYTWFWGSVLTPVPVSEVDFQISLLEILAKFVPWQQTSVSLIRLRCEVHRLLLKISRLALT